MRISKTQIQYYILLKVEPFSSYEEALDKRNRDLDKLVTRFFLSLHSVAQFIPEKVQAGVKLQTLALKAVCVTSNQNGK